MMVDEDENLWFVKLPEKFATQPKKMSASTLHEIESCPRKYVLRRADYSRMWKGYGYPPKPTLKTLEGIIVHRSIEQIIKALKQAKCPSIFDEQFVKTMRSLNGYSGVLEAQLGEISNELSLNPRLSHKADQVIEKLKNSLPLLREQLQGQISKLTFDNKAKATDFIGTIGAFHTLSNGIHSEVELNAAEIEWYGKVDYLNLSDNGCEIADFKTGAKKPEHIFQIKIYNMLWFLDKKRNPNSIPVTKLVLSYKDENLEIVPISGSEVNDFIAEVQRRTNSARNKISQSIPEAITSIENCDYCSVRQLCSAYWTNETQRFLDEEKSLQLTSVPKINIDIEILLEDSIAEYLWNARTLICGSLEPETPLVVCFAPTTLQIPIVLKSGLRLRLLDVHLLKQMGEEESTVSIATNWQSEIFVTESSIN